MTSRTKTRVGLVQPLSVSIKKTVHVVHQVIVHEYPKRTGVPVVAWYLPMAQKYKRHFREQTEFLYGTVKDMTVFFAQGAACSLTSKSASRKGAFKWYSCSFALHSPQPKRALLSCE